MAVDSSQVYTHSERMNYTRERNVCVYVCVCVGGGGGGGYIHLHKVVNMQCFAPIYHMQVT